MKRNDAAREKSWSMIKMRRFAMMATQEFGDSLRSGIGAHRNVPLPPSTHGVNSAIQS